FFYFHAPATPKLYTLSLHDALPISKPLHEVVPSVPVGFSNADMRAMAKDRSDRQATAGEFERELETGLAAGDGAPAAAAQAPARSEEHTSELQSRGHLVCRLLLEKK